MIALVSLFCPKKTMPKDVDISKDWKLFKRSLFSTLKTNETYHCIVAWYEQIDIQSIEPGLLHEIYLVVHRLYVALQQYQNASIVLSKLPEIEIYDPARVIAVDVYLSSAVIDNYTTFLSKFGISTDNAKTALLLPVKKPDEFFNYLERHLFKSDGAAEFNYAYFQEQLAPYLAVGNELTEEAKSTFTKFFEHSYDEARKRYKDYFKLNDIEADYKELKRIFPKNKVHFPVLESLYMANWFLPQKNSIVQILINYPDLIDCILATNRFEYSLMLSNIVFNDLSVFPYLIRPFSKMLSGHTSTGYHENRLITTHPIRIWNLKFYNLLYLYLSQSLQTGNLPANILDSIIEITIRFLALQKDYKGCLIAIGYCYLVKLIQFIILTGNQEKWITLQGQCQESGIDLNPVKTIKLLEALNLINSSTPSVITITALEQVWEYFICSHDMGFGVQFAPFFASKYLTDAESINDCVLKLKITALFHYRYGLPAEQLTCFIQRIPLGHWSIIYPSLKASLKNKTSRVTIFSKLHLDKNDSENNSILDLLLLNILSLPGLNSELKATIEQENPSPTTYVKQIASSYETMSYY